MKGSLILTIAAVAFLNIFYSQSYAQTFLGKKMSIDIGSALKPNLLTPLLSNENYFSQWSIAPTSFQLGIGYSAFSHINFRLEVASHKPQNTGIRFISESLYDTINQKYVDSFYFSSSNIDFNFSVRFYQDFAPIGRYFTLFGGLSFVNTKIIPVTSYWNVTPSTSYFSNDKHTSVDVSNNAFRIGMGYGRTQLLTRWLYLDFGFNASLSYSNKLLSDKEYDAVIYQTNLPEYKNGYSLDNVNTEAIVFSKGMGKSVLNTYFIEFYLNFGISF